MSITQKDISNLESQPELPDTFGKEGDYLRVKTDSSGDTEWTNDINVDGLISATNFRAGNGVVGNPSYSFTTGTGQDCGMFYLDNAGNDELRFATNGNLLFSLTKTDRTSFINSKFLCNTGSTTNPALTFNSTATLTGISGDSSNNIYTLTNANINTTHTLNSFDVGRTNSNNTNTRTLNVNGASNFNSYTPDYSLIIKNQVATPLSGNIRGIDYDGTNYVIGYNSSTANGARISVSSNLTTFTTFNDPTIPITNITSVAFGNGYFVAMQTTSTTRNFVFATSANATTSWTRIDNNAPFNVSTQCNFVKFINGQFVIGTNTGLVRVCTDPSLASNWTEIDITGPQTDLLFDMTYSPELRTYVAVTSQGRVWYWTDSSNTGIIAGTTFSSVSVYRSKGVQWSSKLGMFLLQNDTSGTDGGGIAYTNYFAYSKTGNTWATYIVSPNVFTGGSALPNGIKWISDFGGFFITLQGTAFSSQIALSRNGFNWTTTNNNISQTISNSYYDTTSKRLLFLGSATTSLTSKNLTTDFNNYIDSDAIYNTFNSNVKFNDVLEYKIQEIICESNNNHFTISTFNKPVIHLDTTETNGNIYLQGASYNGRVGTKFKIIKTKNDYNIYIKGFETTRIITPFGDLSDFNPFNSINSYTLIPFGFLGSFELTRISDESTGLWYVENLQIYNANGEFKFNELSFYDNVYCQSNISMVDANSRIYNSYGTTALPSYTFDSDANTGLYGDATGDKLGISTNGIQRMLIDNSTCQIGTDANKLTLKVRGVADLQAVKYSTSGTKDSNITLNDTLETIQLINTGGGSVSILLSNSVSVGMQYYIIVFGSISAVNLNIPANVIVNNIPVSASSQSFNIFPAGQLGSLRLEKYGENRWSYAKVSWN